MCLLIFVLCFTKVRKRERKSNVNKLAQDCASYMKNNNNKKKKKKKSKEKQQQESKKQQRKNNNKNNSEHNLT